MTSPYRLSQEDQTLIEQALREDLGEPYCDVTTAALFSASQRTQVARAEIYSKSKEPLIVCGLPLVEGVCQALDSGARLTVQTGDRETAAPGATVVSIQGFLAALLMAERTALNFLRHLSGIATLTRKFVDAVQGTSTKILDTRKTTPGWRPLEKYAVQCGGGVNHRMGLFDALLIKNNHVDLCGGMSQTLAKLSPENTRELPVILEVRSVDELEDVLRFGQGKVQRLLFDNMPPETLKTCVAKAKGRFETEASGNLSLETIRRVAETGVQYASVGVMTHSAPQVDLSMRIVVL